MSRDQHCARCDDPIPPGEGVTVAGVDRPGRAHEECVPPEYRDFMRVINNGFPTAPPDRRPPAADEGPGRAGRDL